MRPLIKMAFHVIMRFSGFVIYLSDNFLRFYSGNIEKIAVYTIVTVENCECMFSHISFLSCGGRVAHPCGVLCGFVSLDFDALDLVVIHAELVVQQVSLFAHEDGQLHA